MNGKRQDLSQRPELLKGQVEYVAGPEYCLRPPMFPTYLFLLGRSLLRLRRRPSPTSRWPRGWSPRSVLR